MSDALRQQKFSSRKRVNQIALTLSLAVGLAPVPSFSER